jgi:diguanylate cyclase (GGDEF)-like protein
MRSFLTRTAEQRTAPVWFGLAMIALVWIGIAMKSLDSYSSARDETWRIQQNFARVFEENVLRSIGEIDKALLYLRRMIENRIERDSLHDIVSTTDILSEIIVQVAVIDANGIMRASNAGPQPAKPIDLSDREHYRVHVGTATDELFISKPVLGRASNRWSVQLTRRFSKPDGSFGGVVVGSLNPEHFTKFYGRIDLGDSVAISLIGTDGIVRSSGGKPTEAKLLGADVSKTPLMAQGVDKTRSLLIERVEGEPRLATVHPVRGQPLFVAVSIDAKEVYSEACQSTLRLVLAGIVLTLAIALAMVRMAKSEERRQRAESHVRRLASEDPLTGLANRRIFQDAVQARANAPDHGPWALICLDVDRFKVINDSLGHRVGDLLLQEVAQRLRAALHPSCTLARLGGDEFAVLAPVVRSRKDLGEMVANLVAVAGKPYDVDGHRLTATVSVGIALAPDDGRTSEELIVSGDLALYAAKEAGRNGFAFFDREMNDKISRRREVESELRAGLERGEIEAHFQPIFGIDGTTLSGFEALARWRHPVKGWVPPGIFIDVAEDTGLIVPLGEIVMREACRVAAAWPGDLRVAVNLSPIQVKASDVPEMVRAALEAAGLPAHRLEVEITEGLLLENNGRTIETLKRLKELGVRIAMDDFGTGYSSLGYLQSFPLDKIKIDRSFVRNIGTEPSARSIVEAIVRIAHSLGMVTTAEGVETPDQHDILASLGCDQLQGYLFGVPSAKDEVNAMATAASPEKAALPVAEAA